MRYLQVWLGLALVALSIGALSVVAQDNRINPDPNAPIAIYCRADGGIDIYTINNDVGSFAVSAGGPQIATALDQAQTSGQGVTVATAGTINVIVLPDSNILVQAGATYNVTFPVTICGLSVGAPGSPPPDPQPQPNPPPPGNSVTYVVQPGDTLFKIAQRFGVTVDALVIANGIANPSRIFAGQTLLIPGYHPPAPTPVPPAPTPHPQPTCTYIVQPGDAIYKIAWRFGVTQAAIIQANHLVNPNRIFPGQVLLIPGCTTQPHPPGHNTIVVQSGDTLAKIAARYGVSLRRLISVNNITHPDLIFSGQVLLLPNGTEPINPATVVVQRGDTLGKIARTWGTTVEAIANANGILNPSLIEVGQVLVIP